MEQKEVIAQLVQKGAEPVKELKVKNVTVSPQENYVRLGITLDKPVKGYVTSDNITFEEGETKVIFVSLFSVISLLKEDDNAAFACNHLLRNPDSMEVVLSRAIIDILQEPVVAGEEYRNPWSESVEASVFNHDTIINHITKIKLSDFGIRKLDKLADNLMAIKG